QVAVPIEHLRDGGVGDLDLVDRAGAGDMDPLDVDLARELGTGAVQRGLGRRVVLIEAGATLKISDNGVPALLDDVGEDLRLHRVRRILDAFVGDRREARRLPGAL